MGPIRQGQERREEVGPTWQWEIEGIESTAVGWRCQQRGDGSRPRRAEEGRGWSWARAQAGEGKGERAETLGPREMRDLPLSFLFLCNFI